MSGCGDELDVKDKVEVTEDKFLISGMSDWVKSDSIHQNKMKR